MPSKIFIIILNWNGKKDTLECLNSLGNLAYANSHILVVDNGSTDNSIEVIKLAYPSLQILQLDCNLGFAEGNNRGIIEALQKGADYVLLLNNDTIVDSNLITAFISGMQADPQVGILGGKNYLYSEPNKLDHFGGVWNPWKGIFTLVGWRQLDEKAWNSSIELDYVCGCSLFVKKEVFKTVGLLEPQFFLLWEEADFCYRAKKAGFLVKTCPKAKVWHKVSASFVSKPQAVYFWWRNRYLWIERNKGFTQRIFINGLLLIPTLFALTSLYLLNFFQLKSSQLFSSETKQTAVALRVLHYQAALRGIKDYLLRRFGNRSLNYSRLNSK